MRVRRENGPLDKRGWKLGGHSLTMWNSDTFGYDASTDPIYVSVPFYIVLRHGVAFGIFLDETYRTPRILICSPGCPERSLLR
ncbi:MAG TPA: hypothetical protein VKU62_07890 [Thermoanaerobaculia bacterium]|nr:hypothetical protein [Thermoanaerobaculia bacterium]